MGVRKFWGVLLVVCALVAPVWAKEVYTAQKLGYQITVPDRWSLEDREGQYFEPLNRYQKDLEKDIVLKLKSPEGIQTAGVYVLVYPAQGRTLDGFIDAMKQYVLHDMKGDIRHFKSRRVARGGRPAYYVTYEGNGRPYVDGRRRYERLVMFSDDKIYVVHAVSVPSKWNSYHKVFKEVLQSFRLL